MIAEEDAGVREEEGERTEGDGGREDEDAVGTGDKEEGMGTGDREDGERGTEDGEEGARGTGDGEEEGGGAGERDGEEMGDDALLGVLIALFVEEVCGGRLWE